MVRSNRSTPVLLGIVGERCGGKSTASDYLRHRHGTGYVRFSDPLAAILTEIELEPRSTHNLQVLAELLRRGFGGHVLAHAMTQKALRSGLPIVVMDGLRKPSELAYMRKFRSFRLLYITAPVTLRHERSVGRHFRTEDGINLAAFKRLEQKPNERYIPRVGREADFRIDNTGTSGELYEKIDAVLRRMHVLKSPHPVRRRV